MALTEVLINENNGEHFLTNNMFAGCLQLSWKEPWFIASDLRYHTAWAKYGCANHRYASWDTSFSSSPAVSVSFFLSLSHLFFPFFFFFLFLPHTHIHIEAHTLFQSLMPAPCVTG